MGTLAEKVAGVIFGTAIGDALGYPVEFMRPDERLIQHPGGFKQFTHFVNGVAQYSDDTQMMRAVLEGLLRANTREDFQKAAEEVAEEFVAWSKSPENNRAPGNACMAGCAQLAAGKDWRFAGEPEALGSGAAMRSMAYALWWPDHSLEAGRWAAQHARMTHGHPGAQEAAFLTALATVHLLNGLGGDDFERALFEHSGMYDTATANLVWKSWKLAQGKIPTREILAELPGWRSDEAIAAALVCVARSKGSFTTAVDLAVTHCADADTVGAITGALMGAAIGVNGIPKHLGGQIENGQELATLTARVVQSVTAFFPKCPDCGEHHAEHGESQGAEQAEPEHIDPERLN